MSISRVSSRFAYLFTILLCYAEFNLSVEWISNEYSPIVSSLAVNRGSCWQKNVPGFLLHLNLLLCALFPLIVPLKPNLKLRNNNKKYLVQPTVHISKSRGSLLVSLILTLKLRSQPKKICIVLQAGRRKSNLVQFTQRIPL
ncbi:hypothetical protein PGTUg99_028454 [Puccinia graminis f. sp. tritici]|uniref:Uncharacterized protein n=1 Tax=Puccinia graminis f. sp. tritici TaxID=56615 RepID=A0A5B0NI08_PUCGR|nr:hypothetical protein PGTUg99_028454 [Puccinia graminis f. sp. tritici]